jgi:hypothetical protein
MAEIAVLSEHQAPRFDEPKDHATPEDTAALKLVEKCYEQAKKHRQTFDYEWGELWRFFLGDQWKEKRPSYRHSEVINFIFSELQTTLALLTDARPKVEYLAQEPSDYEFATVVAKVIEAKWDAHAWSATVAECCLDALTIGTGISCVPWKPELAQGIGDFAFESEDPYYVFPDPNARTKFNDEYCGYVLTAVPTDVNVLQKQYPDKKALIKADLNDLSAFGIDKSDDFSHVRYVSPVDKDMPTGDDKATGRYAPQKVLKLTLYIKDDTTVEEEVPTGELDEMGQPVMGYQKKAKYPNGRRIVVANSAVLENGANPYENGKFPYARLVDYGMPREFWGVGDVKHLKSPQVIINKLVSYMLDVTLLMGNPIWIVDTTAQVDTDNLTNQPGLVVEKQPGGDVRRAEGVQLQPHILQALETFSERIWNKLSSSKEVSQGVQPTENASGYQLELLQEAAQTKIRSKSRNLDVFLNEVGDLMLDRILQSYDVPRVMRLTGDEGATKYFKFSVETGPSDPMNPESEQIRYGVVQNYAQDQNGQYVPGPVERKPLKGNLDVKITTGSSLAFAKAQKSGKARELFKDGIFDAEDYLNAIEWPGKEKIIQKYKDRMLAMAQAEQAAQQGGAPGAPAAPPQPPM